MNTTEHDIKAGDVLPPEYYGAKYNQARAIVADNSGKYSEEEKRMWRVIGAECLRMYQQGIKSETK